MMAQTEWPCMICHERHSPKVHELDAGEIAYILQLVEDGTISMTLEQLQLFLPTQ